MIVYRNYKDSGNSSIKIFDDCIEFFSPGKLYDDITIEKRETRNYFSRIRSRAIARVFKEACIIAIYGLGIARIKKECNEHGIEKPVFEEFVHGFKVTIFKETTYETTREKIVALLKQNAKYTKQDLMKSLDKGDSTIKEHISNLKKDGGIKRVGSRKSGYWVILDGL